MPVPVTRPAPFTVTVSVRFGGGVGAKLAVTDLSPLIVRLHVVAAPLQAPLQPLKLMPVPGVSVRLDARAPGVLLRAIARTVDAAAGDSAGAVHRDVRDPGLGCGDNVLALGDRVLCVDVAMVFAPACAARVVAKHAVAGVERGVAAEAAEEVVPGASDHRDAAEVRRPELVVSVAADQRIAACVWLVSAAAALPAVEEVVAAAPIHGVVAAVALEDDRHPCEPSTWSSPRSPAHGVDCRRRRRAGRSRSRRRSASSPPRPLTRSSPWRAAMTSFPFVPLSVSGPAVPTIVAAAPEARGADVAAASGRCSRQCREGHEESDARC